LFFFLKKNLDPSLVLICIFGYYSNLTLPKKKNSINLDQLKKWLIYNNWRKEDKYESHYRKKSVDLLFHRILIDRNESSKFRLIFQISNTWNWKPELNKEFQLSTNLMLNGKIRKKFQIKKLTNEKKQNKKKASNMKGEKKIKRWNWKKIKNYLK